MTIFDALVKIGSDPNIEDKLHESVLTKAIKFKDTQAVQKMVDIGIQLNNSHGIKMTPWFAARHSPEIADLMLNTNGSIRLTLSKEEQEIINSVMYLETEEQVKNLNKLNTPELIHAFVLCFNWEMESAG